MSRTVYRLGLADFGNDLQTGLPSISSTVMKDPLLLSEYWELGDGELKVKAQSLLYLPHVSVLRNICILPYIVFIRLKLSK